MSKLYDGAEGAQAPDANEQSEGRPGGSYIWALVIGSMIEIEDWQSLIAITDWRTLFDAYERADDTPDHLLALIGDDEQAAEHALSHLGEAVIHQGTPWSVTPVVVRVVVGMILAGELQPGSARLEGVIGFLEAVADTLRQIPPAKYRAKFEQSARIDISGPLASAIALYNREAAEGEDRNYIETLGDRATEVYFDKVCLDLMDTAPAILKAFRTVSTDPCLETRSAAARGCADLVAGGYGSGN